MKHLSLNDRHLIMTALLEHIKRLREKLIHEGMREGLSSEKTINLSQELDKFIYLYQLFKKDTRELVS